MKIRYAAGDVVAIPMGDDGYRPGVVGARAGRTQVITCFIFELVSNQSAMDCARLRPQNATLVARTSGLFIKLGRWKLIGRIDPWYKQDWIVTCFRRTSMGTINLRITYDPDNPLKIISEETDRFPDEPLPDESLHGSGVIEYMLQKWT